MYQSKNPYLYGTGRRKSSVARVHLFPNGTGSITINGVSLTVNSVADSAANTATMLFWLIIAPLGRPVVPEV